VAERRAEHGSWNRATRAGYQVAFVAFKDGKASADPVPFLTGLVPDPSGRNVNGRPVGVAVASDGALLVSDDGAGVVYRVSLRALSVSHLHFAAARINERVSLHI